MKSETDLRELERKAYLSYHNDGSLDMGLGLLIMSVGIGWLAGSPWLAVAVFIVGLFTSPAVRKMITIPRVGLIRFSPARQGRRRKEILFFLVYFILVVLLGVPILLLLFYITPSPEFGLIQEKFFLAPFGLLAAVAFTGGAYWKQIQRFYVYGGIILVAVIAGPLLGVAHALYFSFPGVVIFAVGLWLMIRFLEAYPLPEKECPDNA